MRATSRITGVAVNTVMKLVADLGKACAQYQHVHLRNLPCRRLQVDEIWSFCYAKEKNVPRTKRDQFGYGDVWTWTAIDAQTKLVPSWLVGLRDGYWASLFISDLADRLQHRVQLTSDSHRAYLEAVEGAFGGEIDYAMLVKVYGKPRDTERSYSPPECLQTRKTRISGTPNPKHISTSYVERQNLTMRMSMRRFTRLTNGFSKKVENHEAAISLHFMYYNFGRIHQTLRCTPAMEAGVTDHVWDLEEIVALCP